MDKRQFLKTSGSLVTGTLLSRYVSAEQQSSTTRTNWAGNYTFHTDNLHQPNTVEEVQQIVKTSPKLRALGARHSFNGIADSTENQISLKQLNQMDLDTKSRTVTVGAGAGSQPLYVSGTAYLAGPYEGAPISLAIVTPAVAGPFDLGVVVTRVALQINTATTQVHAVSDPIPTILQGIPLDVRSVGLTIDRPDFTFNPTNCNAQAITATIKALEGASVAPESPLHGYTVKSRLRLSPIRPG